MYSKEEDFKAHYPGMQQKPGTLLAFLFSGGAVSWVYGLGLRSQVKRNLDSVSGTHPVSNLE